MASLTPFHLAFPVHDLEAARSFYKDVLGCGQGREADTWIDFDMFGHQIVAHFDKDAAARMGTALSEEAVNKHTRCEGCLEKAGRIPK